MPLEIKEIVVTATVTDSGAESGVAISETGTGNGMAVNKEDLIKECVEQVMEILREKNER